MPIVFFSVVLVVCVVLLLYLVKGWGPVAHALSVVVCAVLLLHCGLAYFIAFNAMGFYWFTLPHLILLPLAIAAVAIHAKSQGTRAFVPSLICMACLLPTWFFASSLWPGGDDGPGMAWVVGIGILSLLTAVIGLPLIYAAHRIYQRND